jgi:hypothetical protein
VHHTISEPRLIAAWLSGYYNAKRNNRAIDLQSLEERRSKVTNYFPVPDQLAARVPQTKDYQYAATHDRVLLVATSRNQLRAIEILLRKCIPDLAAAEIKSEQTHRYVVEVPPVLDRDEWQRKYGQNPSLPPPSLQ